MLAQTVDSQTDVPHSQHNSEREVSPIMVIGLRLRVRTIGQRHGEHSERTAQRGNGHHPVDAQGWNEQTHGCRNNHRGRIGAQDQKTTDQANRVHKTA